MAFLSIAEPRAKQGAQAKMKLRFVVFSFLFFAGFASAAEKIDINSAHLEDLMKIVQIGEIRAKELISLRPFSSLDELTKIKGIGEKRLAAIKEQGLAWVSPQTEPREKLQPASNPSPALIVYPQGIIINEILPSPQGPDEKEEWIEIFNQNSFEIDLTGWRIEDSGKTGFIFPENTGIAAYGFLILKRPETKIILNNNGDNLSVIRPDGEISDSVAYAAAPRGQSFNRENSAWKWSIALTPGYKNIISAAKINPSLAKPDIPIPPIQSAAIAEQLPDKPGFSFLFLSIPLAIFSGFAILFLKKHVRTFSRKNN